MLEELKKHVLPAAVTAALTITALETLVGGFFDFLFNLAIIGLLIAVAKYGRRRE